MGAVNKKCIKTSFLGNPTIMEIVDNVSSVFLTLELFKLVTEELRDTEL